MSVYIDTITLIWAAVLLVRFSISLVSLPTWRNFLLFTTVSTFLMAQSGWTVSWFMNDEWGRDISNYLWFLFNAQVLFLLSTIRNKGD